MGLEWNLAMENMNKCGKSNVQFSREIWGVGIKGETRSSTSQSQWIFIGKMRNSTMENQFFTRKRKSSKTKNQVDLQKKNERFYEKQSSCNSLEKARISLTERFRYLPEKKNNKGKYFHFHWKEENKEVWFYLKRKLEWKRSDHFTQTTQHWSQGKRKEKEEIIHASHLWSQGKKKMRRGGKGERRTIHFL